MTSELQRDLVNLTCAMPLERYVIVDKTATTTGLLIPIFLPRTAMGLSPPASLPPLGGAARGTNLVYIPRASWVRRSVKNEEAVVAALREAWAPGLVDVVSEFASVDDGHQGRYLVGVWLDRPINFYCKFATTQHHLPHTPRDGGGTPPLEGRRRRGWAARWRDE